MRVECVTMPCADLQAYVAAYYDYTQLRFAPKTAQRYYKIAQRFLGFACGHDDWKVEEVVYLTATIVEMFLTEARFAVSGSANERSVKQAASALRRFFAFVTKDGIFDLSRLSEVTRQKFRFSVPDTSVRALTAREEIALRKYLDTMMEKKRDFRTVRNALLMKLALYTGGRLSEILRLRLSDIEKRTYKIEVRYAADALNTPAKRSILVQRIIIGSEYDWFCDYYRKNGIDADTPLMRTSSGRVMSPQEVKKAMETVFKRAGLVLRKGDGLYLLRHTYGVNLLRNPLGKGGVTLETLRKRLGLKHTEHAREYARYVERNPLNETERA